MNKQMGNKRKQAAEWIYQYRFALAFILLILLVSFKMNGSSMGCWRVFLGDAPTGVLLGGPRAVRSDEWGTLTPLCFRQQYNTLGAYNRYSQTIGLVRTDNMLVYGQPAWDILTLFRPFYWGYLFFGSERGLSWFWCARLLVLFLSWFELGMLISDGQKKLSVMLGICVSWAPFIQWWFAINGLVEMLIYGAFFVLGTNYLVSHAFNPRKIAVAVGMAVCAVGYVLTFYPTWMVPVAWGFVPLFLWVLIWKTKKEVLCREDIVPWILIVLITAAGLITLKVLYYSVEADGMHKIMAYDEKTGMIKEIYSEPYKDSAAEDLVTPNYLYLLGKYSDYLVFMDQSYEQNLQEESGFLVILNLKDKEEIRVRSSYYMEGAYIQAVSDKLITSTSDGGYSDLYTIDMKTGEIETISEKCRSTSGDYIKGTDVYYLEKRNGEDQIYYLVCYDLEKEKEDWSIELAGEWYEQNGCFWGNDLQENTYIITYDGVQYPYDGECKSLNRVDGQYVDYTSDGKIRKLNEETGEWEDWVDCPQWLNFGQR